MRPHDEERPAPALQCKKVSRLNALKKNSRSFYIRTAIMTLISLVLILLGTFWFTADNPVVNTVAGNIQALALIALVGINVGIYLRGITRLENERTRIIAQLQSPVVAARDQTELDNPGTDPQPMLNGGNQSVQKSDTLLPETSTSKATSELSGPVL